MLMSSMLKKVHRLTSLILWTFSVILLRQSFYFASMLLGLLVVVDAHKKDVASVFDNLRGIVLALDLVEGSVDGMVDF